MIPSHKANTASPEQMAENLALALSGLYEALGSAIDVTDADFHSTDVFEAHEAMLKIYQTCNGGANHASIAEIVGRLHNAEVEVETLVEQRGTIRTIRSRLAEIEEDLREMKAAVASYAPLVSVLG